MMSPRNILKRQNGMIEAGLALVFVAVLIVAIVLYAHSHKKAAATTTTTAQTSSTATTTKDPALDQAATNANASVNTLNSTYTTDTSNSSLNVTQPTIQ